MKKSRVAVSSYLALVSLATAGCAGTSSGKDQAAGGRSATSGGAGSEVSRGGAPGGSGAGSNGAGSSGAGGSSAGGSSAGESSAGGTSAGATSASGGVAGSAGQATSGGRVTSSDPAVAALEDALHQDDGLDSKGLIERFAPATMIEPTYDRASIQGLDKIQGSSIALNEDELAVLARRGFVISAKQKYPTFTYGYQTAYFEHLPVYITADSILHSMHRSYDAILAGIERTELHAALSSLLSAMRDKLAAGALADFDANARADADLYLCVALSLLREQLLAPVAGGDAAKIQSLYAGALAASGSASVELFGDPREFDFSQFKPRGHYAGDAKLAPYFRAMIWLGRTDLRMIETRNDGSQQFLRRQFETVIALRLLVDAAAEQNYRKIDETVSAFVGEHDYMTLDETTKLLQALGVTSAADLARQSDASLMKTLVDGGYGAQRIASQIMRNGTGKTLPLARSFALLGQRYVVDSEVFSNVVYDRVQGGKVARMMPSPLDVAFSVFGNGQAAALLKPELDSFHYAPDLAHMHTLVKSHGDEFWQANLYNGWLSSVRALSPAPASAADAATQGLSGSMRTEAWGRRLLNAQLASWAELRHDTLLYAKQSYTSAAFCEFPDAYVDPYPQFFAKVKSYASLGLKLLDELKLEQGAQITPLHNYFTVLQSTAETLRSMAEYERTGQPFTADMLAFINQAVQIGSSCDGTKIAGGWYPKLFVGSSTDFDPTIADVHTQPTDATGNPVGRVLHVGTGYARMMVVVAENCSGPRVYAGPVSSYYETVTTNFQRLTDKEWSAGIDAPPADVPWMSDLLSR